MAPGGSTSSAGRRWSIGFRSQTEDIDYVARLDGDHHEFISALRSLITEMDVSVEQAGPGDIPLPAGWEDRSQFIGRFGRLDVFTFDPISTALSKIERGLPRDIDDALTLVNSGFVRIPDLTRAFDEVSSRLETESIRVDERDFRRKFQAFLSMAQEGSG
jgi:hypothetical protein